MCIRDRKCTLCRTQVPLCLITCVYFLFAFWFFICDLLFYLRFAFLFAFCFFIYVLLFYLRLAFLFAFYFFICVLSFYLRFQLYFSLFSFLNVCFIFFNFCFLFFFLFVFFFYLCFRFCLCSTFLGHPGGGRRLGWFLCQDHPTKSDVTSGWYQAELSSRWRRKMAARPVTSSSIFSTDSFRNCILWPFKMLLRYWLIVPS